MSDELPLVVVMYERGAATPFDIVRAARGLCQIRFAADTTDDDIAAQLELYGPVLELGSRSVAEVIDSVASLNPEAVVTYAETLLALSSHVCAALGLRGHARATAEALLDKAEQRGRLARAGVSPVGSASLAWGKESPGDVARRVAAELGLPCVVKPRIGGGGSRSVDAVATWQNLASFLETLGPDRSADFVAEELLVGSPSLAGPQWGDYVAVELWCDSPPRVLGVTGKLPLVPPFRETGSVVPANVPDHLATACGDLAIAAVEALGVTTGLAQVEIKLTATGPRLIEVNGRLGGYSPYLYRLVGSVDLVAAALANALGHPAPSVSSPDGVALCFMSTPPRNATAFLGMTGEAQAAAVPGVVGLVRRLPDGASIDASQGDVANAALLYIRGESHVEVRSTLTEVEQAWDIRWLRPGAVTPPD